MFLVVLWKDPKGVQIRAHIFLDSSFNIVYFVNFNIHHFFPYELVTLVMHNYGVDVFAFFLLQYGFIGSTEIWNKFAEKRCRTIEQ